MGDMSIPLQFVFLCNGQKVFVWSNCLLDLGTDILCSCPVRVHDSEAYRKMDVTREHVSHILQLREILLSFQSDFNLVKAAVVCVILEYLRFGTLVRYN